MATRLNRTARQRAWNLLAAALAMLAVSGPALAAAEPQAKPFIDKPALLTKLQQETGLPLTALKPAIDDARFEPDVITRMETPYESRPYADYRPLFVRKHLAEQGRQYLKEHRAIFREEWKRYGVEPAMIAAILAIETHFGTRQGRDRVLDTLYTLSTGFPRRADFFRKQLGDYLKMCQAEGLAPGSIDGSYAGAFGAPQFIPSSYMAYAVDGNGDGRRDVWHSPRDIIFSVANYFHEHGWKARMPVAHWLSREPTSPALVEQRSQEMHEWKPLQKLYGHGLKPLPPAWHGDDDVTLISMQPGTHARTAVISRNFYVITRWNRSYNYAMAATELAHMMGCPHCGTGYE